MHPYTAVMLTRSLETYEIRMNRHVANAKPIAKFLNNHKNIKKVNYLNLIDKESEQGKIFAHQCKSPGAMMSFELENSSKKTNFFILSFLSCIKIKNNVGIPRVAPAGADVARLFHIRFDTLAFPFLRFPYIILPQSN